MALVLVFLFQKNHRYLKNLMAPKISDIQIQTKDCEHEEIFHSYYPSNGLEQIHEFLKTSSTFNYNRPKNYQVSINSHAEYIFTIH